MSRKHQTRCVVCDRRYKNQNDWAVVFNPENAQVESTCPGCLVDPLVPSAGRWGAAGRILRRRP